MYDMVYFVDPRIVGGSSVRIKLGGIGKRDSIY